MWFDPKTEFQLGENSMVLILELLNFVKYSLTECDTKARHVLLVLVARVGYSHTI